MVEYRNSDEIDLMQLLIKAGKIVEKNMILIASYFIAGTLLGFIWYSTAKNIFESKLILTSGVLTESNSEQLIQKLNDLIKEDNLSELSKRLDLSLDEAKTLNRIEIDKLETEKKENNTDGHLTIVVRVTDKTILSKLQEKLIGYLENNDFVKVRVEQKKNYLISLIKKVDEEINGLEEFKTKIFKGDFFATMKGNMMFDPTTVNSKILDLTKERIGYEQALELANSIQVVDGFTTFKKPISPKLSISLASGSFVGLLFVCVLIAFKALRKIARMQDN